jgi:hypothetical protein
MELVGEGGCNVKHIEKQSGASVQVQPVDGALSFVLRGTSEQLAEAQQLCEDLRASLLADPEDGGDAADSDGDERRQRKGSGKGKRKGKSKGDDRKRPRHR